MRISSDYEPETAIIDVQCKMIMSSVFSNFLEDLNMHIIMFFIIICIWTGLKMLKLFYAPFASELIYVLCD